MVAPPRTSIFAGCIFTFGRSVPISSKSKLSTSIRRNGGSTSAFLTHSVTHYVVDGWETKAAQTTANVIPATYITDCVEQLELLPVLPYLVVPSDVKQVTPSVSFLDDPPEVSSPRVESATDLVRRLLARGSRSIAAVRLGSDGTSATVSVQQEATLPTLKAGGATPVTTTSTCTRQTAAERLQAARAEREQQRAARQAELERKKAERMAAAEARRKEYSTFSSSAKKPASSTQSSLDFILSTPMSFTYSFDLGVKPAAESEADAAAAAMLKAQEEKKERARMKARRKKQRVRARKRLEAEAQAEKEKRKTDVKMRVRAGIAANAAEGALRAKLLAASRTKESQEATEREEAAVTAKDLAWLAEQEQRRADWAAQKLKEKEEKKRKKVAFLANRSRILAEDASERGRKLFVGKLTFADINEKHKNDKYAIDRIREQRKEHYRTIFRSLGHISCFKESPDMWAKGHIFVVFCTAVDATNAVAKLQDFAYRKALVEKMAKMSDAEAVPPPCFYVRWPRNTNLSVPGKIAPTDTATPSVEAATASAPKPAKGAKAINVPADLQAALDQYSESDWQVAGRR